MKGHERRHGNAHNPNVSDDDGDHIKKPRDQLGESHDDASRSDDVHYTAEQEDQFEELFGEADDDAFDNDDEEINALILESGALAAVSQSSRTLAQARLAVKDARAARKSVPTRSAVSSAHESERNCFFVSLSTSCSRLSRSGETQRTKARNVIAMVTALGTVSMAIALTIAARPKS